MEVLGGQEVICARSCNRAVKVEVYEAHIQSQCQKFFSHSVFSPSRTTLGELLEKDLDKPTTLAEKKVARNIISRMMAEGESSDILQLPSTRGQVHSNNMVIAYFTCDGAAYLTDASGRLSREKF
jgi:hypothetical protein